MDRTTMKPWTIALALACSACGEPSAGGTGSGSTSSSSSSGSEVTGTTGDSGALTGDPTSTTTGASTSTGATTSSEATSTGATSTGGGFIVPTDGFPCALECDVWLQDCCGHDDQKCVPFATDGGSAFNAVKCVLIARDPVPVGAACELLGDPGSGVDNCEAGSICWPVDPDTLTGTCVAQCKGSPDMPDCSHVPGTTCVITNDGVLTLCLPNCDPLMQDCAAGEVCVGSPDVPGAYVCVVDASGDEGQLFDPCAWLNACDPGLVCIDPEKADECDPMAPGCCLPYCDPDAPSCPGVGQECLAQDPDVGICGLP